MVKKPAFQVENIPEKKCGRNDAACSSCDTSRMSLSSRENADASVPGAHAAREVPATRRNGHRPMAMDRHASSNSTRMHARDIGALRRLSGLSKSMSLRRNDRVMSIMASGIPNAQHQAPRSMRSIVSPFAAAPRGIASRRPGTVVRSDMAKDRRLAVTRIVCTRHALLSSIRRHREQGTGVRKSSKAPDVNGLADRIAIETASSRSIEYRCTLVTPMYGGGVEAGVVDQDMPIRATAIRGQLRYWWRFLHRQRHDAAHPGQPITAEALFAAERAIWGGLGKASNSVSTEGELTKSRVTVRVSACEEIALVLQGTQTESDNEWGDTVFRWKQGYSEAARYALFPAQGQTDKEDKQKVTKKPAEIAKPGFGFLLQISATPGITSKPIPDAGWQSVLDAVRWWAAFGGVGARTRRGLGAVKVENDAGQIVETPSDDEITAANCEVLLVSHGKGDAPLAAWEKVISSLRELRQGIDIGRTPGRPNKKGKIMPGGSLWPEPESIREFINQRRADCSKRHGQKSDESTAFPRAMFGLPIITHFIKSKNGNKEPPDTELVPHLSGEEKESTRMASPLLLRPMYRNNAWHAGALLLPSHARRDFDLVLKKGKAIVKRLPAGTWWQAKFAESIPPLTGHEDPFRAYLARLRAAGTPAIAKNTSSTIRPDPALAPPVEQAKAVANERTLHRPRIKRNNANGSLTIEPCDGTKSFVLIGDQAKNCFDALEPPTQQYLRESRYPPFNKLTVVVDGARFVRLEEYKE